MFFSVVFTKLEVKTPKNTENDQIRITNLIFLPIAQGRRGTYKIHLPYVKNWEINRNYSRYAAPIDVYGSLVAGQAWPSE